MRRIAATAILSAMVATAVQAETFQRIENEQGFVSLVKDRQLKRLGIRLTVDENGTISGRAFGKTVSGAWRWDGGYFCRDLAVGGDHLEFNCQTVQVNGNTLRFISDRGTGAYADLRLD